MYNEHGEVGEDDEEVPANFSAEGINDEEQDMQVNVSRTANNNFRQVTHTKTTTFTVNMGASFEEMNMHVSKCNIDFKENIMKRAETIKLKHSAELGKWVEELKQEEAHELGILSRQYFKVETLCKKLEKKVSTHKF